ncbi:MAG: response regulator transcription factor [Bacteroidales bacterium]
MDHIRAVIIDDERHACERLKKLLMAFKEIELLDCFTSSAKAIEFIKKNKPDLLFLDVELEANISAFDIIGKLKESLCKPHIILVTAWPHYSIKAIKNDVFDYLLKPVDIDELRVTIMRLTENRSLRSKIDMKAFGMLSERENEVLNHILDGRTSKEIADLLFLSINTVHTHRRNILKKTGADSFIDILRVRKIAND